MNNDSNKDKIDRERRMPAEGHDESSTLNHDGSRLGGGGGPVANPTGEAATRDLPIGGPTGTLAEMGQRREQIPGISGGASASDKGVSGWLGGDPSGIGAEEADNYTADAPRLDK
jgi:hypothetical protein